MASRKLPPVELVGERIPVHRLAVVVDGDAAAAAVLEQDQEIAAVAVLLAELLVLGAVKPRHDGGEQRGEVLHTLDKVAETLIGFRELIHHPSHRRAVPLLLGCVVDPGHQRRRMQMQALADCGTPDARPQQQRRGLETAGRSDHGGGLDDDPRCLAGRRICVSPLHTGRRTALGQDPVNPGVRHDPGPGVAGILEVGPHRALLGAGLIPHAAVARQDRVVAVRVDVQRRQPVRIAKGCSGFESRQCGSFCVDTFSLQPIRSITAERWSSKACSVTSVSPAAAQDSRTRFGVRSEFDQLTVLPPPTVEPAAMSIIPSRGEEEPAPQEKGLVRGQFELHEVGLVAVAAGLDDDHALPALGQQAGSSPPPQPEPTTTTSASRVSPSCGVMTDRVLGVCGGACTGPG